jgi:hypothetical protein
MKPGMKFLKKEEKEWAINSTEINPPSEAILDEIFKELQAPGSRLQYATCVSRISCL